MDEEQEPAPQVVVPRSLNERERAQVNDLNESITKLAAAIDADDHVVAASAAREVEIDAYALRLMLRGGRV